MIKQHTYFLYYIYMNNICFTFFKKKINQKNSLRKREELERKRGMVGSRNDVVRDALQRQRLRFIAVIMRLYPIVINVSLRPQNDFYQSVELLCGYIRYRNRTFSRHVPNCSSTNTTNNLPILLLAMFDSRDSMSEFS